MNYLFLRRIRGPVFLLTFGLTAALHQWNVLSFGRSWPLYLIVFGVLRLLEGAALNSAGPVPSYTPMGYQQQGYGGGYQPVVPVASPVPGAGTGLATIPPAPIQTAAPTEEES